MNAVAVMGPIPGRVISRRTAGSVLVAAANRASAAPSSSLTTSITWHSGASAVATAGGSPNSSTRLTNVSLVPLRRRNPFARVVARASEIARVRVCTNASRTFNCCCTVRCRSERRWTARWRARGSDHF